MAARLATIAEIRALSPALSSDFPGSPYPTALLEAWSAVAETYIGLQAWGTDASHGHALLTAHFAARAVAGAFGPAGPLTAESDSSKSYAAPGNAAELSTTTYGAAYLAMRRRVLARAGTMLVANSEIEQ